MTEVHGGHVAILFPGDYETRQNAKFENHRLAPVVQALIELGMHAEPAVYHDDFCDEVRRQLMQVDAVLVWRNPIQDGCDRSILDPMLREVAASGIYVSAHPNVILKMGTKEVLYNTRDIGWGCNTHLYHNLEAMQQELPGRLESGEARVLKQNRGNGGLGVWRIQALESGPMPGIETLIRVRHAKRGSIEEQISLKEFFDRCQPYFENDGRVIDQAYQERLPEGMLRCYLVHDKVVGFGHQAVNALFPAPAGAPPADAPLPGPRLYHPPSMPESQALKSKVEQEWVPAMQKLLNIGTTSLPILWDCDFLLGPKTASGEDTYVLCEINVSSVAPFPQSAPPYIAEAALARVNERKLKIKD